MNSVREVGSVARCRAVFRQGRGWSCRLNIVELSGITRDRSGCSQLEAVDVKVRVSFLLLSEERDCKVAGTLPLLRWPLLCVFLPWLGILSTLGIEEFSYVGLSFKKPPPGSGVTTLSTLQKQALGRQKSNSGTAYLLASLHPATWPARALCHPALRPSPFGT